MSTAYAEVISSRRPAPYWLRIHRSATRKRKPAVSALGKAIPFAHCESVAQAVDAVRALGLESGDAILVKGSNSVGLAKLVAVLAGKED